MRDYGLPPSVWGGDGEGCEHEWGGDVIKHRSSGGPQVAQTKWQGNTSVVDAQRDTSSRFCSLCGAWRGCLGLEPTPELFVQHLTEIMREVKRVLRDDGTLWLNLGDSYAGSGGHSPNSPSSQPEAVKARGGYGVFDGRLIKGKNYTGNGLKPKDLVGIPWRVAFALQADGWWLRSDIIWCLSGGTRLYARTQNGDGPATIKDLVRLDPSTVQLWNGERWTQVLGWSETPRPENPVEIELRSGERIGCTPDHQWPTQRGLVRAVDLVLGDVLESCRLPEPEEPRSPKMMPDAETGWFVGLYIAEGSRSGSIIQIAAHVKELDRFERLARTAEVYGGTCVRHETVGNAATIHLRGKLLHAIIDTYVSGRDARTKHLNPICYHRSNGFLFWLLAGYLEGDAHYDTKNARWRLGFTRNYALEADLRVLAARLGIRLRLKLAEATYQLGKRKSFRGEIRFRVPDHHNVKPNGEVVRIGRSKARKFWHVGVADEPHLFALASGVLTCNSKPNPMPESVTDRPTKAHEYVFLLTKRKRYYYDAEAIKENFADKRMGNPGGGGQYSVGSGRNDAGALKTGIWNADGSATGRNRRTVWTTGNILDEFLRFAAEQGVDIDALAEVFIAGQTERKDVWRIATKSYKEAHFATFPEALITPCILAGTSARGCCPECGAGWERVVESSQWPKSDYIGPKTLAYQAQGLVSDKTGLAQAGWRGRPLPQSRTLGWQPTCDHYDWSHCITCNTPIDDYEHAHGDRLDCGHNICSNCLLAGEAIDHEHTCPMKPARCIVHDPFMGAGTTAKVALENNRDYLGIELNEEYIDMANRRLAKVTGVQLPLMEAY